MSDNNRVEGWFWPTAARKCHFDGGDGRALCGRWARINPYTGGAAEIQGGADAKPSPDDCASCRRKLESRPLPAASSHGTGRP